MLRTTSRNPGIVPGDYFINFQPGGNTINEGEVDEVTDQIVCVDYGNFRVEYARQDIIEMEEHCGFIRTFLCAIKPGTIIERFT